MRLLSHRLLRHAPLWAALPAVALLGPAPAPAGTPTTQLLACCDALNADGCPTSLEVAGPGASASGSPGHLVVHGVWTLTCEDGAAFFPAARRSAPRSDPGEVLTELDTASAACFMASCSLPPQLCVQTDNLGARVVDCTTGVAASHEAWSSPQLAQRSPVIAGTQAIGVRVRPPDDAPPGPALAARPPAATPATSAARPSPGPIADGSSSGTNTRGAAAGDVTASASTRPASEPAAASPSRTLSTPTTAASTRPPPTASPAAPPAGTAAPAASRPTTEGRGPWTAAPATTTARPALPTTVPSAREPVPAGVTITGAPELPPAPSARSATPVRPPEPTSRTAPTAVDPAIATFQLPATPPNPCVPDPKLRDASLEQSDLGDEAILRNDAEAALGHWRAALMVNPCNGYVWSSIGTTLLDHQRASEGAQALETAARLMPSNLRAWTELGRAREALGLWEQAVSAYHEALNLNPAYAPAEAGLRRASHQDP